MSEQSFASCERSGNYSSTGNRPDRTEMEKGSFTPGVLPLSHGIAWAGHKDMLQEIRLYDACVIGGGDKAMALAAIGCADTLTSTRPMTDLHKQHYLNWAKQFPNSREDHIGFVPGTVFHLWHGHFKHRDYNKRHEILKQLTFNPYEHLEVAENGTWRWAQSATALQSLVGDYFFARLEDKVSV